MTTGKLFQTTGRIIRGAGCIARVPEEVARLRKKKVSIITDPGIVATGMIARLSTLLDNAGITVTVFDDIAPDPRLQTAVLASEHLRTTGAELVIGIGGGSAIDIAKVAAILVTNSEPIGTFSALTSCRRKVYPLSSSPPPQEPAAR